MGINFKACNRDQDYILPPSLKDWLPEDELAWFVVDAVEMLDLTPFYAGYREDGKGGSLYEPSVMLAILVYAYCTGERSSRAIERLCKVDLSYRVVAANNLPDHTTIVRFRKKHLPLIKILFTQVLVLCRKAGLLRLGVVALDSVKIKTRANSGRNRNLAGIEKAIQTMLQEAIECLVNWGHANLSKAYKLQEVAADHKVSVLENCKLDPRKKYLYGH